jgi:hydroxyacylglutathione hydrolase
MGSSAAAAMTPGRAPDRIEPQDLSDRLATGAILVDTREPRTFGAGHVAGSLNVWIDAPQFGERVSWFVPPAATLVVLSETEADVNRAVPALARAGLSDVVGFLVGTAAVRACGLPLGTLVNVTAPELAQRLTRDRDLVVLDVRESVEWAGGHVSGARHIPMREITARIDEVPRDRTVAITCAGGARSSLVGSMLLAQGFTDLLNVWGGMTGWAQAGLPAARD